MFFIVFYCFLIPIKISKYQNMSMLEDSLNKFWEYYKSNNEDVLDEAELSIKIHHIEAISKKILQPILEPILESVEPDTNTSTYLKELEILQSNDGSSNTLFAKIDNTQTVIGRQLLTNIISTPHTDISILENRQKVLSFFKNNPQTLQRVRQKIKEISECQEEFYWIKHKLTPEMENVVDMLYFTSFWNKWLNTKDTFMKWYYHFQILFYPAYGALLPIIILIMPYIICYLIFKVAIPANLYLHIIKTFFLSAGGITDIFINIVKKFITIMSDGPVKTCLTLVISSAIITILASVISFGLYLYSIYNNIAVSIHYNKIINQIHKKLNALATFTKNIHEIYQEINTFQLDELVQIMDNKSIDKTAEIALLWETQFCQAPSCFSDKGVILKQYWNIKDTSNQLDIYFKYLAYLDVWSSLAITQSTHNLVPATYIISETPILDLLDVRNIMVNNPITNSTNLGNEMPQNLLITGANASGKSTHIKALIEAVIFAQTITIVPASKCELTPFYKINTYLNIPDCQGKESLFQAEMTRCFNLISNMKMLETENKFAITIMDEIFVSTNYFEGMSGAYAISKKLASFKNSICIIATHFPLLAKICQKNKAKFQCCYFPIKKVKDDDTQLTTLENSYKMKTGVNVEHLALHLLEERKFDKDIIADAKIMYLKLTKPKAKTMK